MSFALSLEYRSDFLIFFKFYLAKTLNVSIFKEIPLLSSKEIMEDIKSIEQFFDYHTGTDPDCKMELDFILKKARQYLPESATEKIMQAYEFAKKAH